MKWHSAIPAALVFAALTGAFAGFLGWFFGKSTLGIWTFLISGGIEGAIVASIALVGLVPYGLISKKKNFEGVLISAPIAFFVAGFSPPILASDKATFLAFAAIGGVICWVVGAGQME